MSLEREDIEKRDFPLGRRGYDPDAVDAHLRALADEVEQLKHTAARRSESVATAASEQVRAIIDAAEKGAAEIQSRSEDEAREIGNEAKRSARRERAEAAAEAQREREEAAAAAQAERDQASASAREYVERVSESTAQMLQRIEAMDSEFAMLTESMRTGGTRLKAEFDLLESELKDVSSATHGRPAPEAGVAPAPATIAEDEGPKQVEERSTESELVPEPEAEAEPALEAAPAEEASVSAGSSSGDAEGARLIALNMALNGTPREETERYLAENFELSDRDGLLDEVYASVDG